jgi:type II secretory pathway component PulK
MKQRGVALIQVLIMIAVLVPVVATVQYEVRTAMLRTGVHFQLNQARQYLLDGETIALQRLFADGLGDPVDDTREDWLALIGPFQLDSGREGSTWSGELLVQISDQSGLLNLNSLHESADKLAMDSEQFLRWFEVQDLPVDWANNIVQWFDPNSAAEFTYSQKIPPFQPSRRMMVDVSELKRIEGYTKEAYEVLQSLVAAHAADSPININFASVETLGSVMPLLTQETLDAIVVERDIERFESIEAVFQRVPIDSERLKELPLDRLSVTSTYFKVQTMVSLSDQEFYLSSIVTRDGDNHLQVVSRQFEPFSLKESE